MLLEEYFQLFKQAISSKNDPLLIFVIVSISGIILGKLFHKVKLPDISGQVIIGIIIGLLFSKQQLHSIELISDVALGVMCFAIGTHLSYKVLHNSGKRILTLAIFDCLFTFSLVFFALYIFVPELNFVICLLVASIAVETAPGTIISLIQKKFSRGVFTKTLVGVVALNNFATIIIFEISKTIAFKFSAKQNLSSGFKFSIFEPILYIFMTIMLGLIIGYFLALITKHQHRKGDLFASVILGIIINILICKQLGLSHLLSNLIIGITYCNSSYHTKQVTKIFENVNELLFAVFFTLAGTHLDLGKLKIAGIAGVIFIITRIISKKLAAYSASRIFNYPQVIRKYFGFGLISQAGLSIGLVISLSEIKVFADIVPTITTIILASVAVNELIGPFFASKSIDLAKETGQSTPRLVDFLHEEYILLPLEAKSKWDAIEKMVDFLVKTNHLRSITRDEILEYTMEREKKCSTGIGQRIAIPHARIPTKEKLMGVIGILKEPIDFESLDGEPVDIIVLIATPKGHDDWHVKMLGAIAKIFTKDPLLHEKLVSSANASEAYDWLQTDQVRDINSFLEEV